MTDRVSIEDLAVDCVIGVHDRERVHPQTVRIDLSFAVDAARVARSDRVDAAVDYAAVADAVRDCAVHGRFHLIETLAEQVASLVLDRFRVPAVRVRVRKTGAIADARHVAVEIARERTARP